MEDKAFQQKIEIYQNEILVENCSRMVWREKCKGEQYKAIFI